jgi:hypothetical protein
MDKVDFKKLMKPYWQPPVGRFVIVDIPELPFVMIDGVGDPNTAPAYTSAVSWLFTVSYTLKFMSKSAGRDFGVAPLEGLWWSDDAMDFVAGRKDNWSWTMMIMQPDWITPAQFALAREKAAVKLNQPPPESVRLERFTEGLSVQTMYVGPYADEGPTIERLHEDFLPANGLAETGKHHEIYLGDPRKVAPEKLRTIIRQPVRRT